MIDIYTADFWNRCFLPFLRAEVHPDMAFPCIIWTGTRSESGHGVLPTEDDSMPLVPCHVYVMRMIGADPGDRHVLHHCDVHPCCNPLHLRLGTPKDNARDRAERGVMRHAHRRAYAPFQGAPRPVVLPRRTPNLWTRPLPDLPAPLGMRIVRLDRANAGV